ERPCTGQPAAFGHHWAGDVAALGVPIAGANLHHLLGVDRFARIGLAHHLPRLTDRAVAGDRHLIAVGLVNRPVGAPADRHLVLLDHVFAYGVALLTDVLLVNRPIGAPADRHLIFLHHVFAYGVALLADVLFVNRPAGRVALGHLVLLRHRF